MKKLIEKIELKHLGINIYSIKLFRKISYYNI